MDDTAYHRTRSIDEIVAAERAPNAHACFAHRGLARLHARKLERRAPAIARELAKWIGPD